MKKMIVRYYGDADQKITNEDKVSVYQLIPYSLKYLFEDGYVLEIYGQDKNSSKDGKMAEVKLLDVFVDGERLNNEQLQEYNKEYGFYSNNHIDKGLDYFIISDMYHQFNPNVKPYKYNNIQNLYEDAYTSHQMKKPMFCYFVGEGYLPESIKPQEVYSPILQKSNKTFIWLRNPFLLKDLRSQRMHKVFYPNPFNPNTDKLEREFLEDYMESIFATNRIWMRGRNDAQNQTHFRFVVSERLIEHIDFTYKRGKYQERE